MKIEPCCGFCKSINIGRVAKMMFKIPGFYVYCKDCGALITWVPKPKYAW